MGKRAFSSFPAFQRPYNSITRKSKVRGVTIGICVSILTSLLMLMGFLRNWESGIFDFLIWWEKEKRSADVFLIEIDDKDYKDIFKATSPISRVPLAELLKRLSKTGPAVIAFDIDLVEGAADDRDLIGALEEIKRMNIPVVLPLDINSKIEDDYQSDQHIPFIPSDYIDSVYYGAVNYPFYQDGIIRDMYIFKEVPLRGICPFFPLSVVAAFEKIPWREFKEALNISIGNDQERVLKNKTWRILKTAQHTPIQRIRYIGDRKSFNSIKISSLLSMPSDSFTSQGVLSGKILLIGGTYKASRDFYQTPKGQMSGLEIIANSVETLLSAHPLRPINHAFALLFEIGIVLLLTYFFLRFSALRATLVSLISILPLSMVGSLVAFSSFNRWLSFIPVGLSIVIHGQYSFFEHYAQLKRDVGTLQSLLKKSELEITRLKTIRHRRIQIKEFKEPE